MAEIPYSIETLPNRTQVVTWVNVTEADTFQRYTMPGTVSEISVHIRGTFGGATVVIKGSNHAADGVALDEMDGTASSTTAEDIYSILDRPLYITPTHSGGTSESVTVNMAVRR